MGETAKRSAERGAGGKALDVHAAAGIGIAVGWKLGMALGLALTLPKFRPSDRFRGIIRGDPRPPSLLPWVRGAKGSAILPALTHLTALLDAPTPHQEYT